MTVWRRRPDVPQLRREKLVGRDIILPQTLIAQKRIAAVADLMAFQIGEGTNVHATVRSPKHRVLCSPDIQWQPYLCRDVTREEVARSIVGIGLGENRTVERKCF